jgi:GNAT superfamily N-acetyltransferase
MNVQLASPAFDDWSALHALLRASFAYMDGRIDPPSSLDAMTEADLRAKAQRERLVVAYEGDKLIGCAFADLRADCVYIGKVAVATHARGRGVARRIIAVAEALARAAGRGVLELQTRVELVENHRTFAALGFTKVAETAHEGYSRPTSITMQRPVALSNRVDCQALTGRI